MKLFLSVLSKSDKLGIDNSTLSRAGIMNKLGEEYQEVQEAIINFNKEENEINLKEVVKETFDLIQICILILWRCRRRAKETYKNDKIIEYCNGLHLIKLTSRGWTPKEDIFIRTRDGRLK